MAVPFPSPHWFEEAFGFAETSYGETQKNLMEMKASSSDPTTKLRWKGNYAPPVEVTFGSFSTPSVQDLRAECTRLAQQCGVSTETTTNRITWDNIQASVMDLHADPANTGAIFQAASQFNCLEMVSPAVKPEEGIARYQGDFTQGPACAISCGPGTAFRNYLVEFPDGDVGQKCKRQINTLAPILARMTDYNNGVPTKVSMRNGYANATNKELTALHGIVHEHGDELIGLLKVGVQRDTEVTHPTLTGRLVTQVYCSAVPVSYSHARKEEWAPLGRVVLKGAYEATLLEAVRKHLIKKQQGTALEPTKVFLTMVGGGAFGNDMEWIWEAMEYAHNAVRSYPVSLDVHIVHYGGVASAAIGLVTRIHL